MNGSINRNHLLSATMQTRLLDARTKRLHRPCQIVSEGNRVEAVGSPDPPHTTAKITLGDHPSRSDTGRREQRRHLIRLTDRDLDFGLVSHPRALSATCRPQNPQAPLSGIFDPWFPPTRCRRDRQRPSATFPEHTRTYVRVSEVPTNRDDEPTSGPFSRPINGDGPRKRPLARRSRGRGRTSEAPRDRPAAERLEPTPDLGSSEASLQGDDRPRWYIAAPSNDDVAQFRRLPRNQKIRSISGLDGYSGGRIRTCDLRVMSPTSYLTAPPRGGVWILAAKGWLARCRGDLQVCWPVGDGWGGTVRGMGSCGGH